MLDQTGRELDMDQMYQDTQNTLGLLMCGREHRDHT
jgi:hypothetical protein